MKKCSKCKKEQGLQEFYHLSGELYATCRACRYSLKRAWYKANREAEKLKSTGRTLKERRKDPIAFNKRRRARRKILRDAVLNKLGRACRHCGIIDERVLQVDHVESGGRQHRKQKGMSNGSTPAYLRSILDAPEGTFQLLCANCNIIKYHEKDKARYAQIA